MKLRAALLTEAARPRPYAESCPLVVETVDLDGPRTGEVLIEIAAAGLCHSDLSTIEGIRPRPLPAVLGHESAGIVREVGAEVSAYAPGDHVVTTFVMSCGHCPICDDGRPYLCESSSGSKARGELLAGGKRLSLNGQPISHAAGVSCFAEYAVVAQETLVKMPDDLPLDIAALFGCAVMTGVGAVLNTAGVQEGQAVCVVGLGGVGYNAVMGAVIAGAAPIIAVDTNPTKFALARDLGATHCIDPRGGTALEQLRDLTGGGVRHAIEAAGTVPALEFAYAALAAGGMVTSVGLTSADAVLTLPPYDMVSKGKGVQGSYMGSCTPPVDIPRFIEHYRHGRLPLAKLLSGTLPLEDINEGFDRLAAGDAVRQILAPHGSA